MPSLFTTLSANFLFELRSILRRPTFYVATTLLFIYWSLFSSRLNMDPNFWGPRGGVFANAPVVLYFILATQAFVTFLFVPLVMGLGPLREQRAMLTQAWLATPMRPVVALWGRFLAAFSLLAIGTFVASCGILLSPYLRLALGKIPGLALGPIPWTHLVQAWALIILPTLFFASALVYWLVVLTKRSSAAIAATLILVLGAVVSHYFGKTMHFDILQVIDPTAFHAVHRSVSYWSIEQRNHDLLPVTQLFLANRVLWLAVGLLLSIIGSLTFKTSRFAHGAQRRWSKTHDEHLKDHGHDHQKSTPVSFPNPRLIRGEQFVARFKTELHRLIREPLFNAILIVFFLWLLGQNLGALELEFIKAPAQAELLLTARRGLWMLVFYFVPYVTASTVFFERDLPGSAYLDALPVPNWIQWLPKLVALACYCGLFPLLVFVSSLCTQLGYGEYNIQWDAYGQILLTSYYPHLLQFVFASFAIALLCPTRAVAYAATMLALYASIFGYETANLDSELGLQMYEAMMVWSPFDGLGPYASKVLFKSFFWLCVSAAGVTLATAFWKRGQRKARLHQSTPTRAILLLLFVGASLLSARMVHQKNLAWASSRLRPESDAMRVHYERTLAQYRDLRPPAFRHFTMTIGLDPQLHRYHYDWSAQMPSNAFESEPRLFVQTPVNDNTRVSLNDRILEPEHSFPELGAQVFHVNAAEPRDQFSTLQVIASHQFKGHPKKRERPLGVLRNGSYLDQSALPEFAYTPALELDTSLLRASHQLKPQNPVSVGLRHGRRDCPWSGEREHWAVEISTTKSQQAIAPGKLERTWIQDGRRFFRYQAEDGDCTQFAFASAAYQTLAETWTLEAGQIVQGEILHLDGYDAQALQIKEAVGSALTYLSGILGPYPYKELRVVQVRNDANLGIAPANTLFLRENEAWSLRVDEPRDEHQRLYYITQRLAQHWLHNQLAPADAPGKGLFTEGIPAFLAYTWLGEKFGEKWLQKKYLHRAMRRYFWYHGTHTATEAPVVTSPTIEHIHIYKAVLALRVLKTRIGTKRMHALLRDLVNNKLATPVTASAFVEQLNAKLPQAEGLAQEMLQRIVHYDNRLNLARARVLDNNRVQLTLEIQANRWELRPGSMHPELVPWHRPLPVMIRFSANADQSQQGNERIEELAVHNGTNIIELELPTMPTQVWIDPQMQLLDLSIKDQRLNVAQETR